MSIRTILSAAVDRQGWGTASKADVLVDFIDTLVQNGKISSDDFQSFIDEIVTGESDPGSLPTKLKTQRKAVPAWAAVDCDCDVVYYYVEGAAELGLDPWREVVDYRTDRRGGKVGLVIEFDDGSSDDVIWVDPDLTLYYE